MRALRQHPGNESLEHMKYAEEIHPQVFLPCEQAQVRVGSKGRTAGRTQEALARTPVQIFKGRRTSDASSSIIEQKMHAPELFECESSHGLVVHTFACQVASA